MCPIVSCGGQNIKGRAAGISVSRALERVPMRVVAVGPPAYGGIQLKALGPRGSVEAELSTIDIDVAAVLVNIDPGVGVPGSEPYRQE